MSVEAIHAAFCEAGYPEVRVTQIGSRFTATNVLGVPKEIRWRAFQAGGAKPICWACYCANQGLPYTDTLPCESVVPLQLDCGLDRA